MKTTRYKFEQTVQSATTTTVEWLRGEFKAILESNKDYTRKADYIGFSIASIDTKIASIDEEVKELQELKKNLKAAKEVTLEIGAQVFAEYGIDKLEGAGISSITLTNPIPSSKVKLTVNDEEPLITAGFFKKIIDTDAIMEAYKAGDYLGLVNNYCTIEILKDEKPIKLKVNKRRGSSVAMIADSMEVAS